jgi:small neutral amino acid transporter SnatA (MarC family)
MQNQLQAIVTILSLVNPGVCMAMFARIQGAKAFDATKVALATLIILGLAALFGTRMLKLFGISLAAFSATGGLVLCWIGFAMLRGGSPSAQSNAAHSDEPASIAPLILFAASPGTITAVVTLAAAHTQTAFPTTALVASLVAAAVLWLTLLLVARLGRRSQNQTPGFLADATTRFMGLIVVAMGAQFILSGTKTFYAG